MEGIINGMEPDLASARLLIGLGMNLVVSGGRE